MLVVDSSILVSAFLPDETGPDLEALFDEYDEVLARACCGWNCATSCSSLSAAGASPKP